MTTFRKFGAAALAAVTLAWTVIPADAQWRHRRHHRGGNVGAGIAAGVIGGALLGAALAPRPTYAAPVYGAPAYGRPAYVYDEPPVYYAPRRPSRPVLISQQPTRNCVINTYQDAYGRQFSRKVCPRY